MLGANFGPKIQVGGGNQLLHLTELHFFRILEFPANLLFAKSSFRAKDPVFLVGIVGIENVKSWRKH